MRRQPALALALVAAVLAAACQLPPLAGTSPQPKPTRSPGPAPGETAGPAAPAQPAERAQCGQVVTKHLVLANDLICEKDGLVAGADGIVIDLNGRTLTGPGMGEQTWPRPNMTAVGIKVEGRRSVTVRNGKLAAFTTNILYDGVDGGFIEGIESTRSRYGTYLRQSTAITVRNMLIHANIYGLHLQESSGNLVVGNELVRQTYNSPGGYGLYLFSSNKNRFVRNTIEGNLNWGCWLSDSRENQFFHNNIARNNPQTSDNVGGNVWHDPEKKEGNYWGDYGGLDRDGDLIGDSPYRISGPGEMVDPYPFVERDGWKKKTSRTIDHYQPPAPKARLDVALVALAGGALVRAAPADPEAARSSLPASAIAIAPDRRTVFALSDGVLVVLDAVTGAEKGRFAVDVPGLLAANRDGKSAIVVGPSGAVRIWTEPPDRKRYEYTGTPVAVEPSWKHNMLFVSTERGIDVFYIGLRGGVPYTIPLDGPGGPMVMNRSGTRIYAVALTSGLIDVVDTEQYAVIERLPVPFQTRHVAVSPDDEQLYLTDGDRLAVYDIRSRRVIGDVGLGGRPVDVAVSPNGDHVFVAVEGAGDWIAVIGTIELREERRVRVEGRLERLLMAAY